MKAIKFTSTKSHLHEERLVVKAGTSIIMVATPTLPTEFMSHYVFSRMLKESVTEEVNLEDFPKLKHHLHKMIRKEMKNENV